MNDRKQHVVQTAHKLFIEKGYQATSIQDILDESGISKGTFYNYFSSKGELLIAIFKALHQVLEKARNDLLIGQDRSDINIFTKQIELQMKLNRQNKLFSLFEEVFVSNDKDLKQFIKDAQLLQLNWVYLRFIDLFGEMKKPYLLDSAIMFSGILHHNIHYHFMADEESTNINPIIRYSVNRIVKIVEEVAEAKQQLLEPERIEKWLPGSAKNKQEIKTELLQLISKLKKIINKNCKAEEEQNKYIELLEFIQEELLNSIPPRKFVIESALITLKSNECLLEYTEWHPFEQRMLTYLRQEEN